MPPATDRRGRLSDLLAPLRAAPREAAILADLDGTLSPIVLDPADSEVPRVTRVVLGGLARRYALVGCISGRRASDLMRLVGIDGLFYVGNHGFEVLPPGADEPEPAPLLAGHERAAAEFVARLSPGELEGVGIRVEDKGAIQALHVRGAPDEEAARAGLREIAAEAAARDLVPHWGRKVLEIRPAVGLDKGTAVAELLERQRLRHAFYGGDDRTDVDAFTALREMHSAGDLETIVCIGVASDETPSELVGEADVLVEGTGGFLAVLRLLDG